MPLLSHHRSGIDTCLDLIDFDKKAGYKPTCYQVEKVTGQVKALLEKFLLGVAKELLKEFQLSLFVVASRICPTRNICAVFSILEQSELCKTV